MRAGTYDVDIAELVELDAGALTRYLRHVLAHLSMNRAAGQRISAQVAELREH